MKKFTIDCSAEAQIAFGAVAWGYAAIETMREYSPALEFDTVASISRVAD